MSNNRPVRPRDEIFHVSLNPAAKESLVLLHGIFCCNLEFALVAEHLPQYHLIIVDLPGHSGSKNLGPSSLSECASHVAQIIRVYAKNGKAHVAGLSYGGFVAMQLASEFPELIASLWVSGAPPFQGWQTWMASHPRVLYCLLACLIKWMPDWLYGQLCKRTGMLPHDELRRETKKNFSMDLLRKGYGGILDVTVENATTALAKTDVRTLLLGGELQDNTNIIRSMAELLKTGGNNNSTGMVVRGALHGWDLQFPGKFAQSIDAWINQSPQPEGIEKLT